MFIPATCLSQTLWAHIVLFEFNMPLSASATRQHFFEVINPWHQGVSLSPFLWCQQLPKHPIHPQPKKDPPGLCYFYCFKIILHPSHSTEVRMDGRVMVDNMAPRSRELTSYHIVGLETKVDWAHVGRSFHTVSQTENEYNNIRVLCIWKRNLFLLNSWLWRYLRSSNDEWTS